jgi:1-deoxy-D-xylulose-5-phosphate synthase
MLHDAMTLANDGPVVIRYPKGKARTVSADKVGSGQKALRLAQGDGTVAILAIGKMVGIAEQVVEELGASGISATLWDVRSCVPLDEEMLADAMRHKVVLTAEDGLRDGGIGCMIADRIHAAAPSVRVENMGVPTKFIPHHKPDAIFAALGLDTAGMCTAVRQLLA